MGFFARLFGIQTKDDKPSHLEPVEIIGYGETVEEAVNNAGDAFSVNLVANKPDQIAIVGKEIVNTDKK